MLDHWPSFRSKRKLGEPGHEPMSSPEDDYPSMPTPELTEEALNPRLEANPATRPSTEGLRACHVMREVRAQIVTNTLKKGAIGAGVGIALSLGIFRRRISPIFFSTGFGLGYGLAEGNQTLRDMNERIRQIAIDVEKNRPRPQL